MDGMLAGFEFFYWIYLIPTMMSLLGVLTIKNTTGKSSDYLGTKYSNWMMGYAIACMIPVFNWRLAMMAIYCLITSNDIIDILRKK
jgi:hypothetical protein